MSASEDTSSEASKSNSDQAASGVDENKDEDGKATGWKKWALWGLVGLIAALALWVAYYFAIAMPRKKKRREQQQQQQFPQHGGQFPPGNGPHNDPHNGQQNPYQR